MATTGAEILLDTSVGADLYSGEGYGRMFLNALVLSRYQQRGTPSFPPSGEKGL
jgi:hypothetical protein